ncbi:hypothetical protein OROGR_006674 [Orobanche gracilis]
MCGMYSVKSGYGITLERKLEPFRGINKIFELVWNDWAPLKAKETPWRIISRKIATKNELMKRGVYFLNSGTSCSLCGSGNEMSLLSGCLDWIDIKAPMVKEVKDNFLQFSNLAKVS